MYDVLALPRLLSWSHSPTSSPLNSVPADILLEIASYFSNLSDVLHLSLVSSNVYPKLIAAIYASVELHGPTQCEATLAMLHRCPAVARHVRTLVVRPERRPRHASRRQDSVRTWETAGVISRRVAAAARSLDALQTFEWDGEDMLPDDHMWSDLRSWCPSLQHIGTTFGCFLPRPSSHLFHFSDLKGFSLTFKDGFYGQQLHIPSRESEPVYSRVWDMLIHNCPNLERLSLAGTFSEPSDAQRLRSVHWPRLRMLSVGDVIYGLSAPLHTPPTHPMVDFLERHPTIESLHLYGHPTVNPLDLAALDTGALPALSEFSGSLDHLRALLERGQPNAGNGNAMWAFQQNPSTVSPSNLPLVKTLTRVCLPEPMQLREMTPLAISRVLMELPSLTSLKITFALHSGYDSTGVLRTIVASCPQLLDLDLSCACKPSFFLESFSRSLRKLARLRTLQLTIVRQSGEEPMHVGATRIALSNPRLTRFSISYMPAHTPALPRPLPLEKGSFELVCDQHDLPISLLVSEWRASLGGSGDNLISRALIAASMILGVGGGSGWRAKSGGWSRHWISELRPSGHPDVRKDSLMYVLLDRSPAGEEMRLLVFCIFLLTLVLWGTLSRAAGRHELLQAWRASTTSK
ncbi:hypothetical protein WOLCODRAFT_153691 [Wolfiporia cocos MD-104 SS10]|uniref:F-box domain-containing protein n=1 Tax=Wolfiporia cocos (strain MD-104) TaxID=742152 RepID=A0A2H3K0L2_WOLCO|nr:hypothetical protein WOLCODRAFT_153691 [Wolfiporia cocos MD-104 SS10]